MHTSQEHLIQAAGNEEFAESISSLPVRFTEWEVTALFYSALHYVSAFLATQGHDVKSHKERRNLVAQYTNVSNEYDNLFQYSLDARYEMIKFTPEEVELMKVDDFRRVKEDVLALLPS